MSGSLKRAAAKALAGAVTLGGVLTKVPTYVSGTLFRSFIFVSKLFDPTAGNTE